MSITSLDSYMASTKQVLHFDKTATLATTVGVPYSCYNQVGHPGILSSAAITAPWVTIDTYAGFPPIVDISKPLYLTRVSYSGQNVKRLDLYDCLLMIGIISTATANPTFTTGDITGRFPVVGGTTVYNSEIWLEMITTTASALSVNITYTNQEGMGSRTTSTVTVPTNVRSGNGAMIKLPLQTNDFGVRSIQSVNVSGTTGGTFNILLLRPLWSSVGYGNFGQLDNNLVNTGMPQVFPTSAIFPMMYSNTTTMGLYPITIEISG